MILGMPRRSTAAALNLAALLAVAGFVAVTAGAARANSGGITGRSGKQGATCTQCHGGGVAPEVAFIGPGEVLIGETTEFVFELRALVPAQRAGGFNIAASDGRLDVVEGQGERRARNGELTHVGPVRVDDNHIVTWAFRWTAPDAPGTYTLFGAGNAVNLNGQSSGDRSSTTTFDVVVREAFDTPTPSPTPTPPPDTPTATATFGPVACVGDCDDGNSITVNELVTGVNVALGNVPLSACPPFDANGDRAVAINELVAAVNAALGVCIME